MNCSNPECGALLAAFSRVCLTCGHDAGAPNVRAARDPAEVTALQLRYIEQKERAVKDGYDADFDRFEVAASQAFAVICMPMVRLLSWVADSSALLATYGEQVEGEARVPLDNDFDGIRSSVEEAIFPNYSKKIRFAALSMGAVGQTAYGGCSVTLKNFAVADRASTFDMPLFVFAKTFSLRLGEKIPVGHRSDWIDRGKLAEAKVGSAVAGASDVDLPKLLLPLPNGTESDCIEIHIFGPLNRASILKIVIEPAKRRADKAIQRVTLDQIRSAGIDVEIA